MFDIVWPHEAILSLLHLLLWIELSARFFVAKADTFSDFEWSHNNRGSGRLVSPLPDTVRYYCHLLPFLSQLCQVSVQTTEAPATESNSESRQFQGRVYLGVVSTSDESADKETTLAPSEIGYMLPRSGTCPKSRLDAHRVMYSHVELCSCWLQSLHGMFNLIPLAGAQQVTWPNYFTFRFFENTADVQFWAILEQSLHMCGHPLSSKCAIRCRDFWRKGMCFGSCLEVKQKMRSVSAGDHSGRMHQSSWVLEEVSWSKAASQWYRFFVSLRARKNDEFGSLDRAEFDPAYYHSIMSGYSPPAWLRCVTSISKMWDLEFPLEDNSGKWCRERLSTLIPTLRVVSTATTIGIFSSTHARQQTRTRPKLIGNLFAKGQWTALGSLRRTWSLLQPGIRPGILHQMHQQPSWIFLDLPYPGISRVLWNHCSWCSCSILFQLQNLNLQAPDDVREEAAKIRLFCFAWTPFRPGDEAPFAQDLAFRLPQIRVAYPICIWFVNLLLMFHII